MSSNEQFTEQTVHTFEPMVRQIASEYHRKYTMVERQDIIQEIWLWFATHTRKMSEWADEDQKDRDKLVARSLRNAAYDFCIKEKARVEGYNPDDVFFYNKEFIKILLPAVVANDWARMEGSLSLGGKTPKAASEANDWMAYSADIKKALDSLDEKDRKLVEEFYGNDMHGSDLHEQILPEKSTARAAMMQANRALNKMVRSLGGTPPYRDNGDSNEVSDKEEVKEEDSIVGVAT